MKALGFLVDGLMGGLIFFFFPLSIFTPPSVSPTWTQGGLILPSPF